MTQIRSAPPCPRCGGSGTSTLRVTNDSSACALCAHMWWVKEPAGAEFSARDLKRLQRLQQSFRVRLRPAPAVH